MDIDLIIGGERKNAGVASGISVVRNNGLEVTDMTKHDSKQLSSVVVGRWTTGKVVFLTFLGSVAVLYGALVIYHYSRPMKSQAGARDDSLMAQCREFCLAYGLLPTGNIANDARQFLDVAGPKAISQPLVEILEDPKLAAEPTQAHSLLGQPAPAFDLPDDHGVVRKSTEWTPGQPTVLVFYYGYGCSHCVAQLFGIDRDLQYFHELGAEVVAVSADPPDHTAKRFEEYGRFHFPVLSDAENRVAQEYGAYVPPADGEGDGHLEHATFVIDSRGRVVWAYRGPQPFLNNRTLLLALAKAQGITIAASPLRASAERASLPSEKAADAAAVKTPQVDRSPAPSQDSK